MRHVDPELTEELRALLDAAAERAQPWLHRIAEGSPSPDGCGWCPVCNAVALVRGDRPELAARAAEHVAGLIAVLRAALAEEQVEEPAPAEKPRVQHIPVVRRDSRC